MSDISSNGQPEPEFPVAPRIEPPEGQRAARGQFSSEFDDESEPNPVEMSVADAPTIEDSYEPPLGFDDHDDGAAPLSPSPRPDTPKDVELGLMQHLGELRQRLLYCAMILMVGMVFTWNYSEPLQKWFSQPIQQVIKGKGTLQAIDPTGFFSITVQFSLVSALILTAPLLFWQVWRFIEPALTHSERRYSIVLVPFSSALFFLGAGLAYAVAPFFFKFFIAFQPVGVAANWDYYTSIVLMAKMLLVFGVMFQVPIFIIFFHKIGLISRNVLIQYWRHAVVVIFIVAAVLTPTWDPVTLAVCAVPPCLLYVLSIWLIKWL
ncbi:MAG: twin-arginine translocase subunit TatC [Armatimonadetes bacterium]|nr:twin-arginine translocase subunit TatC [Armatimonadota bacterium]